LPTYALASRLRASWMEASVTKMARVSARFSKFLARRRFRPRGRAAPEVSAAILRADSRLKAIRNWRGETQLHLNFMTGIGQGYLSDLESGRRTGTPETIEKLAEALKVPVEWLS
jgi:hypothetical protein